MKEVAIIICQNAALRALTRGVLHDAKCIMVKVEGIKKVRK